MLRTFSFKKAGSWVGLGVSSWKLSLEQQVEHPQQTRAEGKEGKRETQLSVEVSCGELLCLRAKLP